ncbi:cell adhesion molecule-like protein [Euroglyphus maynei]|uniref:Cell adhesion molecule-like protein n=1 Tax=Euroglyphus maynei TaxID=6958 RepID=A0A1Y3BCB8_EURMA|nr:cell adhesion molecule-like protein [Euroglyphus maynei]
MSSLIIANISRHHQGTYTCMASSPIATTNVSEFLSVKATPQWLLKPVDQDSVSGESLTLDCQTSGQPPPVIRWKFLKNEPYRNEPIPILSSQQIHVLENGSLFLRALEPKHSGIYICDASNEVSKHPIESRAYVTVSSLPKVSIQNTLGNAAASIPNLISKGSNSMYRGFTLDRLILHKGSQTQLMCSVIGLEQPMVAEWLRPNGETSDEWNEKSKTKNYLDSSRIVLREESKMNEKRAYLYISHVGRMDSGIYCCMGINTNGFQVSFIELLVQEPPDMPVNFRAQEINSQMCDEREKKMLKMPIVCSGHTHTR